jgi:hypothetical protein
VYTRYIVFIPGVFVLPRETGMIGFGAWQDVTLSFEKKMRF